MSLQRSLQNGRSGKSLVISTGLLHVGHFTESVFNVISRIGNFGAVDLLAAEWILESRYYQ
jgi:hypothetical protein